MERAISVRKIKKREKKEVLVPDKE